MQDNQIKGDRAGDLPPSSGSSMTGRIAAALLLASAFAGAASGRERGADAFFSAPAGLPPAGAGGMLAYALRPHPDALPDAAAGEPAADFPDSPGSPPPQLLAQSPITPSFSFSPAVATVTLSVPEYLGNRGVAPVSHPLGQVSVTADAASWSIVHSPPAFRLAAGARTATIELAQTVNLDFEHSSHAADKRFATVTVQAAGAAATIRQEVVLELADAVITRADSSFSLLGNYIRFVDSGEIVLPNLRLNGFEQSSQDTSVTISISGVGAEHFSVARSGDNRSHRFRFAAAAPGNTDVRVTFWISSVDGTVRINSRVRLLERPRFTRIALNAQDEWEFEYAPGFRCDLITYRVWHSSTDRISICRNFNLNIGSANFRTDSSDGVTRLIVSDIPVSGQLTLGGYTSECDGQSQLGAIRCRSADSTSFREVFSLPLSGRPFIAGGARQIIRIPGWNPSWMLAGSSPAGAFPVGYILATVNLSPGFAGEADWSLEGASDYYGVERVSNSRAYIVVKRQQGVFDGSRGLRAATVTVRAANRAAANVFSASEVILELVADTSEQDLRFQQVGARNIIAVVPNIERRVTIWGVSAARAPLVRIDGDYQAALATGPLPYWLRFDPATRVFTVLPAALPGDYRVQLYMADRTVSPPEIVEHEFTLRILQPLYFGNVGRSGNDLNSGFFAGGLFDAGDSGDDLDRIVFMFNGETTTFREDIRCGVSFAAATLTVKTGNSSDDYKARFYPECHYGSNSVRLLVQSAGTSIPGYSTSDIVTLSLEINIAGTRQTVVQTIRLGNTDANIGGSNRSGLAGGNPEVIVSVGSSELVEGRVLAPETGLFTLSISSPPVVSYSTAWQLNAYAENSRLFEIHDSDSTDAIAILRVRSGVTLTLDHESMGDIRLGVRLTITGPPNGVFRRQQLILRVADDGRGDEPHFIPVIAAQGVLRGQRLTFSARAVDPEAVLYEQHETYTYSLDAVGASRPGWVRIDPQGQVEVLESAATGDLTVRISAVSDATVTASRDATLAVVEPLRHEDTIADSGRVSLFFSSLGGNCRGIVWLINNGIAQTSSSCDTARTAASQDGLSYYYSFSSTADGYFDFPNRGGIVTLIMNVGYGGASGTGPLISQTMIVALARPHLDPNPLVFVNAADPQLIEIAAAAGSVTTHRGGSALSFASGHSFVTLQLGGGVRIDEPVVWSAGNANTVAAAADIGALGVAGRGIEAAVGFPASGGRRVIPDDQYPFTITVSATNSRRMVSKELVFSRAAPGSRATLATVLVTVNSGSVAPFTRRPVSPTGGGVTYEAMLVDAADRPQALPAWLRIDAATGQFSLRPDAVRGVYLVRVFALSGGRRAAAADFPLLAVTPPRVVASRASTLSIVSAGGSTEFVVDMGGLPIARAMSAYTADGSAAASCGERQVRSLHALDLTGNDCRLLGLHVEVQGAAGGAFTATISATSDLGSVHSFELAVSIERPGSSGSLAGGGTVAFVPDSFADFVVHLPATVSIAAAATRLATLVVNHSSSVRAELINDAASNFGIGRGSSASGNQTIYIQSDQFTGALFPDGVTEYRLNLRVAPATDAVPWVHRNVIIRSTAALVTPPSFVPGLPDRIVPYRQGRVFLLGRDLRNPDRLPIAWQLLVADGPDAGTDPDELPAGVSFDPERLAVTVQPSAAPTNLTLMLRGTYYAGTETGQIRQDFELRILGEPLQVTRSVLHSSGDFELWLSSLRDCVGNADWGLWWTSTATRDNGHRINNEVNARFSGNNACDRLAVTPSLEPLVTIDVADIDEPSIIFVHSDIGNDNFDSDHLVTVSFFVDFPNEQGRLFTRSLITVLDPMAAAAGTTVSITAPEPPPPPPATITVRIAELVGAGAAAAVGRGAPVVTVSHAAGTGAGSTWRLIGVDAGLLQATPVSGAENRQALVSWARPVTLDHENPDPPAVADLLVTLVLENSRTGESVSTRLRLILENVDEADDNAPPFYTGPDTFILPAGTESVITLTLTDPEGDTPLASMQLLRSSVLAAPIGTAADLDAGELTVTLTDALAAGEHLVTVAATDSRGRIGRAAITLIIGSVTFDSRAVDEAVAEFAFSYASCGDVVLDIGYGSERIRYSVSEADCRARTSGGARATRLSSQPAGFVSAFTASPAFDPAPVIDFTGRRRAVVRFAEFPVGMIPAHSVSIGFSRTIDGIAAPIGAATSGSQAGFRQYLLPQFMRTTSFSFNERNGTLPIGTVIRTIALSVVAEDAHWSGGSADGRLEIVANPARPNAEALVRLRVPFDSNFETYRPNEDRAHHWLGGFDITLVNGSGLGARKAVRSGSVYQLRNINDLPVMPAIADQGPYGARGDTTARTFTVGPATDEDFPADTITYAASSKGSSTLPAWLTFDTASAQFTVAVGDRPAGAHVIEVTPMDTGIGATVEFTLNIVDYIAGATTTLEVDEAAGHNATRAGGVSIGVVTLARPISGVSWSLRGTSSRVAVAASSTSANTEAVIRTAGSSSATYPFDYEINTNPNKLFERVTLVAVAGDIEYAQVVDVVLADVDEQLVIDPIPVQSAVAGIAKTISMPEATNPAGVAATYALTRPDGTDLSGWLSSSGRELRVSASTTAGNTQMVKYRVEETGNSANFAEQTVDVNIVAPSTGTIVLNTAGLTPLTRVDGSPNESTTTEVSVHLSDAPVSRNVTLTLANPSHLIDVNPDFLVFTPSNYSSPQPVTVSVLQKTAFGFSDTQVNVEVHNATSSDENYIFTTAKSFTVNRRYVNRLPVLDAAVPRLIVLAKPSSAVVVLTMTATDTDGDGLSYSLTNAEDYNLFASGQNRARFANQRLTILPGIAGGEYELRMSITEDHGRSSIPHVPATLVVGELSFDSGGHAVSSNAASFTFSYAPCGDLIVDVGYGSEKTRYRVAEAACRAAAGAGVAAGKLSPQPDGFVASFTGGYDPAPTVNFSTSGKVVVAFAPFALDVASESYSVSLAFVRRIAGRDVAHGRATSGMQGSYANYRTPVFARADATESVPERNTVAAGHVFLTLTLSDPAAVPTWSGGSTDGALEVVASPTAPKTEALLRLKAGKTVNFDHDALSAGSISISIRATVANGSGSNAKTVARSFNLVAGRRNDEVPVLAELANRGPYVTVGDSTVRIFTIPAATDRDRDEGTDFSYQVSLVTGGSTVALPGWITFNQASRQVSVAASGRVAGDHVIVVKVSDGGTNPGPLVSAPQDFTLFIIGVGQPTFAASRTTFALPENSGVGVVVGTVAATDGDDRDASDAYPVYAITGADAAAFAIDAASGVISVKAGTVPDFNFEASKNSYRFEVTATDADGNVGRANIVVNLTDTDEALVFAASSIEFVIPENGEGEMTPATYRIGTVAATDPDAGSVVTYRLTGADAALFHIDADGVITPAAATEFVAADRELYSFTVEATSGRETSAIAVVVVIDRDNPIQEQDVMLFTSVDRAIAVAAVDLIGARFEAPTGVDTLPPTVDQDSLLAGRSRSLRSAADMWAEWEYGEELVARDRGIEQMRYMRLREFVYNHGFDLALAPAQRGPQVRLWGSGSRTSLEGNSIVEERPFAYDGEVDVLMFGLETRAHGSGARLGLAYSNSEADFILNAGKVTRSLQQLHPYLSFDAGADSTFWLSMGIGRGEYGRDDDKRDTTALSAAAGGSIRGEMADYRLGLGARFVSGRSVLERSAAFAETRVKVWRAEFELEVGREFSWPEQDLVLQPFVSFDGRRDGGSQIETLAFDAGGGLRLNWAQGLQLELSGQVQATDDDHKESRLEGSFSYDYNNDGRGLSLSAAPRFERIENEDGSTSLRRTVVGNLGYGLPMNLFVDSGLSRLSVSATAGGDAAAAATYGWSFAGRRLGVDLSASGSDFRIEFRIE